MADLPIEDEDDEPTAPFWMATFSDMATLLMTFFILIVAMSEVQVQRFKEALSYFPGRTSMLQNEAVMTTLQPPTRETSMAESSEAIEGAAKYEQLLAYLEEEGLADKVQVNLTREGLHVVMRDDVMFHSGEAELIEPSRSILSKIADVVRDHVESVSVRGHTDAEPIATPRFPSNWELSGARASSVVRYLLQAPGALDPVRYAAAGFAEYHPVASNQTPEGRARNRRVEITFSWEPWPNQTPLPPTP